MTDDRTGARPPFTLDLTGTEGGFETDGRLDSPSFHRNRRAILAVLTRLLGDAPAHVLEIGSGTGQHVTAFAQALPHVTWWPSDPNPDHRRSIAAWAAAARLANVARPLDLDATAPWDFAGPERPPASQLAAVIACNVIHIAPWDVAKGIVAGAARHLAPAGRLILYGPFARGGVHNAPSNAAFDRSLRAQDPAWGVRDLDDVTALAAGHGLRLDEIVDMPANNLMVIFARAAPD
jgi:SAM-dependent methyltransferase